MNKKVEIWIKVMDWCSKYWGCHQIPERSFFFKNYQFPICARCTGIIIGYITAIILCILQVHIETYINIFLIIPMGIDGTVQFFTSYTSNNFKRFITGILAGIGFISIVINFIHYII